VFFHRKQRFDGGAGGLFFNRKQGITIELIMGQNVKFFCFGRIFLWLGDANFCDFQAVLMLRSLLVMDIQIVKCKLRAKCPQYEE